MAAEKTITLYLHPELIRQVERGKFNFVERIRNAVSPMGYDLACAPEDQRHTSRERPGFALFHRDAPDHPRALTLRKVYHAPFWAIEKSAKRWEWSVAKSAFDPAEVDEMQAKSFAARWRRQLFDEAAPGQAGHVYVPLQGRLLERRSFQAVSPMTMLGDVLRHVPGKQVVATLHPGEIYSRAEEMALEALAVTHPNLTLAMGQMETYLPGAAYLVTQNSSAAFNGYFFGVPAILYAQIDFHHIGLNVAEMGVERAFAQVADHRPDFEAYIYWFWQVMSINAGRPDAEEKILAALKRGGWTL